jgi:hypothetical protein
MKKTYLLAILMIMGVSTAGATVVDLTGARGDSGTVNGAIFTEFDDAMQFTVSSGTGVIDPFLTIQHKVWEEGFNSDFSPLVLDTTRPKWNHSIQISDLGGLDPNYYDFLLDLNEPNGDEAGLTQHEMEVWLVPNAGGGSISSYAGLAAAGTMVWDLDGLEDSRIEYNYDLWNGSGQNFDALAQIPVSLFAGYSADTYVYLYALFGDIDPAKQTIDGYPSGDGFEEYALREGGTQVPEPATMLLFGTGLAGLAGLRLRSKKN